MGNKPCEDQGETSAFTQEGTTVGAMAMPPLGAGTG